MQISPSMGRRLDGVISNKASVCSAAGPVNEDLIAEQVASEIGARWGESRGCVAGRRGLADVPTATLIQEFGAYAFFRVSAV